MKYEELPKWIQKYLSDNHEHLVNKTYKGDAYGVDGYITEKYDKWFDKNQNIYYDEDSVIGLIEILIKNYKKTDEDIKNEMLNLMCKDDYDPEPDHMKADELLCTLLKKLGYNEIVDIYQNVEKWYI